MLAAQGEGFVSEGDGVVSFYVVLRGASPGVGLYIWCSHVSGVPPEGFAPGALVLSSGYDAALLVVEFDHRLLDFLQ